MGPALKVLNRQHQGLMTMLRQLDKLGVVGTRVLNASTDNIVASLRHLQPTLTKLGDAGDSLADGLSMLASFPFPKEAANIVRGDYANALFQMDINLNTIIKSPGEELPNLIDLCSATPAGAGVRGALASSARQAVCARSRTRRTSTDSLCPAGSQAVAEAGTRCPAARPAGQPGRPPAPRAAADLGGLLGGGGGG